MSSISGQMTPLLQEFPFSSADIWFIGNPITFVVFDGYPHGKDQKGDSINIVLMKGEEGEGKTYGGRSGMFLGCVGSRCGQLSAIEGISPFFTLMRN